MDHGIGDGAGIFLISRSMAGLILSPKLGVYRPGASSLLTSENRHTHLHTHSAES